MGKKKNAATKPEPKKDRKVRDKMRSRKDSAAGHFADRLAANIKQREDIMTAVKNYPGVDPTVQTAHDVHKELAELAVANFVPPRKRSGRSAVTFVAGQKVTLAADAIQMLKTQFPKFVTEFDTAEFFVSDSHTDNSKAQLPLRMGASNLDAFFLGFISRKWAS